MRDPYQVLGLDAWASEAEIKKAYRQRALARVKTNRRGTAFVIQ